MEIKKHKLIKAHIKAMRKNAYKRIATLHTWMDGVKEDRAECMAELAHLDAKVEMANDLLKLIKEMK